MSPKHYSRSNFSQLVVYCYTGSTRAAGTQLSQHFNTTLKCTYQHNNKNKRKWSKTIGPLYTNSDYLHKHACSVITTGNENTLQHTHGATYVHILVQYQYLTYIVWFTFHYTSLFHTRYTNWSCLSQGADSSIKAGGRRRETGRGGLILCPFKAKVS